MYTKEKIELQFKFYMIAAGAHNFNLEKDCAGAGGTGLGLGTKVPLPPGRITGSASIETLVRVGIEKENGLSPDSKMVIVDDFTPCVDDELQVKRGQVSNILLLTWRKNLNIHDVKKRRVQNFADIIVSNK